MRRRALAPSRVRARTSQCAHVERRATRAGGRVQRAPMRLPTDDAPTYETTIGASGLTMRVEPVRLEVDEIALGGRQLQHATADCTSPNRGGSRSRQPGCVSSVLFEWKRHGRRRRVEVASVALTRFPLGRHSPRIPQELVQDGLASSLKVTLNFRLAGRSFRQRSTSCHSLRARQPPTPRPSARKVWSQTLSLTDTARLNLLSRIRSQGETITPSAPTTGSQSLFIFTYGALPSDYCLSSADCAGGRLRGRGRRRGTGICGPTARRRPLPRGVARWCRWRTDRRRRRRSR